MIAFFLMAIVWTVRNS